MDADGESGGEGEGEVDGNGGRRQDARVFVIRVEGFGGEGDYGIGFWGGRL